MSDLQGCVAVITGAASGLGLAFSEALSAQGANLVLADINEVDGRSAQQRITAAGGVAIFQMADISRRQEARALVDAAVTRFGHIDILINNAGLQHISPLHEFDEDRWDYLISVMLTGPFLLTRYALPHMMARKQGRIINIGSIHSLVASEYKSAYVAAKHGLLGLTKVTALEGGPHNVTCVAVCPSYVRTPLVERQIAAQARQHNLPESEVTEQIMLAPASIKRLIEPSEIGALILYLCGSTAQAITGTAISIDCGWTAR